MRAFHKQTLSVPSVPIQRFCVTVPDLTPAFKWAVGLNAGYVLIEATAGFVTGSLALLADAAHNLTDVAGILIAWRAVAAAKRPPSTGSNGSRLPWPRRRPACLASACSSALDRTRSFPWQQTKQ